MSRIDINELLNEITTDLPCGQDCSYEPLFGEMERAAKGKADQQIGDSITPAEEPDWVLVHKKALELFKNTKDLRVAVYLTQALLNTRGFTGLSDGLSLIKELLTQYWESVHPALDPDEKNDPTERVNALVSLCDVKNVLRPIRETELVKSKLFGRIRLRDVEIATGKVTVDAEVDKESPELSVINAAFLDSNLDDLTNNATSVQSAVECTDAIESIVEQHVSIEQSVDLGPLSHLLKEAQQVLSDQLKIRGQTDGESSPDLETDANAADLGQDIKANSSQSIKGVVKSREDVIRMLDSACDYYRRHEPSSPVPLLLQRAKRLVSKDFMEIIRDLTPSGVAQVEQVTGGEVSEKG